MDIRVVSKTLDVRLSQMPSLPPVAWPNIDFKPDIDTIYLRPSNLPANGSLFNMNYAQETPGVYQVSVAGPVGDGAGLIEQVASDVSAHFGAVRSLDNNIFIESIDVAPAIIDDVYYTVPVSINWRIID
jgi:hypothetical protein